MKIMPILAALPLAASLLVSSPAAAAVISATFSETLDLPGRGIGPRVFEASGLVGQGAELDRTNEVSNPSVYYGYVEVDLSEDGLLSLIGRWEQFGQADYAYALITVSNIMTDNFQFITGVTTVSESLLSPMGFDVFSPMITSTSNSVSFLFDRTEYGSDSDFNLLPGGSSVYQLNLAYAPLPAPLPASGLLLAFGIVGLASAFGMKRDRIEGAKRRRGYR